MKKPQKRTKFKSLSPQDLKREYSPKSKKRVVKTNNPNYKNKNYAKGNESSKNIKSLKNQNNQNKSN